MATDATQKVLGARSGHAKGRGEARAKWENSIDIYFFITIIILYYILIWYYINISIIINTLRMLGVILFGPLEEKKAM